VRGHADVRQRCNRTAGSAFGLRNVRRQGSWTAESTPGRLNVRVTCDRTADEDAERASTVRLPI